jgi:hypothetical protein
MSKETDLERKIRALEEENAKLKARSTSGGEFTTREDSYKGSPILVFERPNAKPFSLGVSKLSAIRICWHKVEEFLLRHGKGSALGASSKSDYSDEKI